MFEECVLTTLELNWNQRLGHKKTKLNICHHMLTSSTQLQNRSFHVVERTRTSLKCQKMKNARAKRAKLEYCFSLSNMQICGLLLPSSSWLLKPPIYIILSLVLKRIFWIYFMFAWYYMAACGHWLKNLNLSRGKSRTGVYKFSNGVNQLHSLQFIHSCLVFFIFFLTGI